MSKIVGNEETIKRIKESKPGDPCVYVNMEAIMQLPDDFEATPTKVEFDPEVDFTNLGSDAKQSMYPSTKIMYLISDARGISIYGQPEIELLYEEVNISEMEMVPNPVIQKKKVGYIVKKTGFVVQDDGTPRTSGHIGIFNAWDECSKLWANEEKWTEGYSKDPGKWPDGKKKENKYDTKWKRRLHFQEMLDNSLGQADTKAWLKCIRDLAGLLTGYTKDQIKGGKFYFMKIRRSEAVRKAETAARLQAIANGSQPQPGTAQPRQLADTTAGNPIENQPVGTSDDLVLTPDPEPLTEREQMHKDLSEWKKQGLIPDHIGDFVNVKKSVDNIIQFLERAEPEKNTEKWNKAKSVVAQIRATIPAGVLNTKPEPKKAEDIF